MDKKQELLSLLLWTSASVILGVIVTFLFLPLMGINASSAMTQMITEVFSDKFAMGNILIKAAPLILTGLAFSFTYKANLYNIGAQGQFYVGCIFAVSTSLALQNNLPGPVVIVLSMLASMIGGALMGWIIGFLKAKFNANEFLTSMMSTYVVIYLMQFLLRTVLQEDKHEYLKTNPLDKSVWLPKLIPGTAVSWGIVVSVLAAIIIWFILYRTSLGYRIRVTGANMEAARLSGIDPKKEFMVAFAISGAVAGLAGFVEINGMQHMLLTGFDGTIGSYGIGIAIMSNANPIAVIFSSLLFGFLRVGGTVLAHSCNAPTSTIDLMLGFVMVFVLISFYFRNQYEIRKMKKSKLV